MIADEFAEPAANPDSLPQFNPPRTQISYETKEIPEMLEFNAQVEADAAGEDRGGGDVQPEPPSWPAGGGEAVRDHPAPAPPSPIPVGSDNVEEEVGKMEMEAEEVAPRSPTPPPLAEDPEHSKEDAPVAVSPAPEHEDPVLPAADNSCQCLKSKAR